MLKFLNYKKIAKNSTLKESKKEDSSTFQFPNKGVYIIGVNP